MRFFSIVCTFVQFSRAYARMCTYMHIRESHGSKNKPIAFAMKIFSIRPLHKLALYFSQAMLFIAAVGCSSDVAEVYPDGSDEIRISMGRSFSLLADPESGYRPWNRTIDPTTMGVIATTNSESIFNNASFSAPALESETEWIANDGKKKYWLDYSSATSLDFFAYMPHIAGATLDGTGSTKTLTLPNVPGILGNSDKPYLVISSPLHFSSAYGNTSSLALKMDQLMTCLCFQFMLGDKMSTLRTFKITNVKVSEIPVSATVAQPYTLTDGAWTKGSMTLNSVSPSKTYTEITHAEGIKIGYNNNPSQFTEYPGNFYMLPFDLTSVIPEIEVTYDVYDEDGYKTRSVTSTILLNAANFGATLGTLQTAHRTPVKIKIVPDNLYILSDADQSIAGYLVVGQQ